MRFPTNSSSSSFDDATDENSSVREEEEDQSAFFNRRQSVLSVAAVAGTSLLSAGFPGFANETPENGVYDFTVRQYGKPFALAKYKGKVTVIVNVASE